MGIMVKSAQLKGACCAQELPALPGVDTPSTPLVPGTTLSLRSGGHLLSFGSLQGQLSSGLADPAATCAQVGHGAGGSWLGLRHW